MKFSIFSAFFKACSLSRTSLLYRMPSSLSTTFFNFFRSVFLSISMRAIASFYVVFLLSASLWQLDYLTKDITSCQRIFASFLPFFDFFFTWILRPFAGEWSGRALPFANTCFVAFAESSSRTAEQRKYRWTAIHYNVWKPWIRIRIFAEIRLFSHSAHLSTGSMVYNS